MNTVLFYTEQQRCSGKIIEEQAENVKNNKNDSLEAMHNVKHEAFRMKNCLLREELQDTLRYAHENGMEIENHTLEHKRHFQMDDATFERQIYLQCLCVDKVLGVDYQEHFVRPFGGDGRDDLAVLCSFVRLYRWGGGAYLSHPVDLRGRTGVRHHRAGR